LNEVRVQEKLDAAVIALEDKAFYWFVWREEQTASRTWDEFKLTDSKIPTRNYSKPTWSIVESETKGDNYGI
jgi:hypothetical protein